MEFLIRNFDSTHTDPDIDRRGCRKRGMCDQTCADGEVPWHTFSEIKLPKFVVIKVPGLTEGEIEEYNGLRKVWRDTFDYEVIATRPAQGEFDIRIFETAPGLSGQNSMTGAKLTRVRNYLAAWGCSNFAAEANGGSFTFSLWDAVRSANFWEVNPVTLAGYSFALDSYTDGVGTITLTVPELTEPAEINRQVQRVIGKVTEQGGAVTQTAYPAITFTIERNDVLAKFRKDVKRKIEMTFMYQRDRINSTVMDVAVAAGGVLTLTKAEFLSAIRNMAAE